MDSEREGSPPLDSQAEKEAHHVGGDSDHADQHSSLLRL